MRVEFHSKPSYTMAVCYLDFEETIRCESGSMAAMSDTMHVSADAGPGGLVKGLLRKSLGGESLFMGRYQAGVQDAWVAVAPRKPGDIEAIHLDEDGPGLIAESGSFLAMSEGINVDVKWAGMRNIVLREGATMLRITGTGTALVCSYGGIVRHVLGDGQSIVVDTGHLVAYDDTCDLAVGPLGGVVTAGFTGEGLVARITGRGPASSCYVQTRAESELKNWLFPERGQNR